MLSFRSAAFGARNLLSVDSGTNLLLHLGGIYAEPIKCSLQIRGDRRSLARLDVTPRHHENELPIPQNRNRWRRRQLSGEIATRLVSRFPVLPRKHRVGAIWARRVLHRHTHGGTHATCSASAD